MKGALRRLRQPPATVAQVSSNQFSPASLDSLRPRAANALVFPSVASSPLIHRSFSCRGFHQTASQKAWSIGISDEASRTEFPEWSKDGRPGQSGAHTFSSSNDPAESSGSLSPSTKSLIQQVVTARGPGEARDWEHLSVHISQQYGHEGVWEAFMEIRRREFWHLLSDADSSLIRDHILLAALSDDTRMTALYESAQKLRDHCGFEWPGLYLKVVNFYLDHADYENAFLWHLRLALAFPPSGTAFGTLLARFADDPATKMQSTLASLYMFSSYRNIYDHLIPALFNAGQSALARKWRKKLLLSHDVPQTLKSRPFLTFLARYYPKIPLVKAELAIADLDVTSQGLEIQDTRTERPSESAEADDDGLTAQWFANSWPSADSAVDCAYKLGVREVGPEALRALAIREGNAQGFLRRVAQIEKLKMRIKPWTYSRGVIGIAKIGDHELFADLLRINAHSDEFESRSFRRSLLTEAIHQQDRRRERLLREFQLVLIQKGKGRPFNKLLQTILNDTSFEQSGIGKARLVLDRMESLNIPVTQTNASKFMERLIKDLRYYPLKKNRAFGSSRQNQLIDRAINVTRRLARPREVAIKVRHWRILIYQLGWLGRFKELNQLGLELVHSYTPSAGGQLPVHRLDVPLSAAEKVFRADCKKKAFYDAEAANVADNVDNTRTKESTPHSPYSEEFWKAEMGERYRAPAAVRPNLETRNHSTQSLGDGISEAQQSVISHSPSSQAEKTPRHSPYSEEFWKAEMGEKYKSPADRRSDEEIRDLITQKIDLVDERRTKDSATFFASSQRKESQPHSPYSEEFLKAEIGERYTPPPIAEMEAARENISPTTGRPSKPDIRQLIPADLPFSHREHPVQKVFDARLQRAIVRWGFDQTLTSEPSATSDVKEDSSLEAFDVAVGVRILASLRDAGVLIDQQVVRSALFSRIAVAQVSGRPKARSRDGNETSPQHVKSLVDKAWGSELLPPIPQLIQELEKQKPKLWKRYPRLFRKSYDSEEKEYEELMEGFENEEQDNDEGSEDDQELDDELLEDDELGDEQLEAEELEAEALEEEEFFRKDYKKWVEGAETRPRDV